jgi:hypothetical protein
VTTRAATLADAERALRELDAMLLHTDRALTQLAAVMRLARETRERLADDIGHARLERWAAGAGRG